MMRREATWLGRLLERFTNQELGAVLSIGSGTKDFRRRFQPWIDDRVFEPLERRGVRVLHHELDPGEGVDISGDLRNPAVRAGLADHGVRTVLCLNVLEHVPDPAEVAGALAAAVPAGGRVVVTVPRRFPYHADPIDTMFRPDPDQLRALFAGDMSVDVGSITCESLVAYWLAKPGKRAALSKLRRRPDTEPDGRPPRPTERDMAGLIRMALLSTEVTYAVAARPAQLA